jgi:hypothetical protein
MIRQFLSSVLWPPLDYLLIDTPPGTSDEHISLVETLLHDLPAPPAADPAATSSPPPETHQPRLAGAVVVTTPQAVSISDVRKELNFCAKTGVRVLGVVENMSGYVCECCGVETNLFSKGGGEVMAHDFGVRFLGRIPIDVQWGVLVEEGGWCVYGGKEGRGGEAKEDEGTENTPDTGKGAEDGPTEAALLVDRYRGCSLCPVLGEIARLVVETVENGTGVLLAGTVSTAT